MSEIATANLNELFTEDGSLDRDIFQRFTTYYTPLLPHYYCKDRDLALRNNTVTNPFLGIAVNTLVQYLFGISFTVVPKDESISAHSDLSQLFNTVFQSVFNGDEYLKFLSDLFSTDNGGFMLVTDHETPSHLPLLTIPKDIIHLDSQMCQRTSDKLYPVIYWIDNNVPLLLHYSRVIHLTEMPSADSKLNGVGYSFASRAFPIARHLFDASQLEDEYVSGRNAKTIWSVSGARSTDVKDAFDDGDIRSDNAGNARLGQNVYIGLRDPNAKLSKFLMSAFPEGYVKRDDIEVSLMLFALASGTSGQVWFDSVSSGSTRASAQTSDSINQRKLATWFLQRITSEINFKFLPLHLQLVQTEKDQDTDGTKSRIKLSEQQRSKLAIDSGISTIRVEREKQLSAGTLTRSQFRILELADNRLESGMPIHAIFFSESANIKKLLGSFSNPLDATVDDLVEIHQLQNEMLRVSITARTAQLQNDATVLYYALLWLESNLESPKPSHLITDSIIDDQGSTNDNTIISTGSSIQAASQIVEANNLTTTP